jgi:hypothetical protein
VRVIPHARRDNATRAGSRAHRLHAGLGIRHEVENQLRHHDVERRYKVGQRLCRAESNICSRYPSPARFDERGRRVDGCDALRTDRVGERLRQRARAAADVEDAVILIDGGCRDVSLR